MSLLFPHGRWGGECQPARVLRTPETLPTNSWLSAPSPEDASHLLLGASADG